jgi:hypothetical protein
MDQTLEQMVRERKTEAKEKQLFYKVYALCRDQGKYSSWETPTGDGFWLPGTMPPKWIKETRTDESYTFSTPSMILEYRHINNTYSATVTLRGKKSFLRPEDRTCVYYEVSEKDAWNYGNTFEDNDIHSNNRDNIDDNDIDLAALENIHAYVPGQWVDKFDSLYESLLKKKRDDETKRLIDAAKQNEQAMRKNFGL